MGGDAAAGCFTWSWESGIDAGKPHTYYYDFSAASIPLSVADLRLEAREESRRMQGPSIARGNPTPSARDLVEAACKKIKRSFHDYEDCQSKTV